VFGLKVKMKLQSNLIYPALVWASYGGVHIEGFQLRLETVLKTNQAKISSISVLYSISNVSPSEIAEALSLLGSAVPSIEGVGGGFDPVLACPKSKAPLTYSSR
jgi:hypothetical protein